MKTKNQIAQEIYGVDYTELTRAEKAEVAMEYADQDENDVEVSVGNNVVLVNVGVIGNGFKGCVMQEGDTVKDAIERSGLPFSADKHSVKTDDGEPVDLRDEVESGVSYIITPEIKSA